MHDFFCHIFLFLHKRHNTSSIEHQCLHRICLKFSPQISLKRNIIQCIFRCVDDSCLSGQVRIFFSKLLSPSNLNRHNLLNHSLFFFWNLRKSRGNRFVFFWSCRLHHISILFHHQISSLRFSLLKILPVTLQKRQIPYQKLAFAHHIKRLKIILTRSTPACISHILKHLPLHFYNLFYYRIHLFFRLQNSFHMQFQKRLLPICQVLSFQFF